MDEKIFIEIDNDLDIDRYYKLIELCGNEEEKEILNARIKKIIELKKEADNKKCELIKLQIKSSLLDLYHQTMTKINFNLQAINEALNQNLNILFELSDEANYISTLNEFEYLIFMDKFSNCVSSLNNLHAKLEKQEESLKNAISICEKFLHEPGSIDFSLINLECYKFIVFTFSFISKLIDMVTEIKNKIHGDNLDSDSLDEDNKIM